MVFLMDRLFTPLPYCNKFMDQLPLAGIPGSPATIHDFLMDAAGDRKPCNHVVSSQKVWKTSLKACRRQVFQLQSPQVPMYMHKISA